MEKIDRTQLDIVGIGKMLSEGQLSVPPYQRSYSWEDKQVIDYLEDIRSAIDEGKHDYFIGSIVVIKGKTGGREIVDGQQRLATTSVILSAARDLLAESELNENLERGKIIEERFLFKKDLKTLEKIQNLQLNLEDNSFFSDYILSKEKTSSSYKSSKPSHKKLQSAYQKAKAYIRKNIITNGKAYGDLISWVDYLESNVKVIWILVDDYSYAYTIFETLNDRGLDLTVTDLLKNLIFSRSGSKISIALENWTSMTANLESFGKDGIKVDFIRHYWASRNGLTRERELYTKIKGKVNSSADAIELSDQLNIASELYSSLLNSEHPSWDSYGLNAKNHIKVLNMLGMSQNRPLLIAVLLNFESKQVNLTLRNLVNWAVRFIITGSLGSSVLEQNFSENAKLVSSGEIKNIDQLFEGMKDAIPSDDEFRDSFKIATIKRPDLAKYFLSELEKTETSDKSPELIPNLADGSVNLEHILPKKLTKDWKQFTEETAQAYLNRIGNLCLLKARSNSEIGNVGFDIKLKEFNKSKFELTKMISEYSTWGSDQIEERQAHLAEIALKTWRRRVSN